MTLKKLVSVLFVLTISLTLFSCGGDDPITRKPKQVPDVAQEELIGNWNVVSINDKPPLEFVHAYEPPTDVPDTDDVESIVNTDVSDEQEEYEIDIDTFHLNLATDDSYALNAQFRTTLPLPVEDAPAPVQDAPDTDQPAIDAAHSNGGRMIYGEVEISVKFSGTYSIIEGPMLFLNTEEEHLSLTAVDEGTFKNELMLSHEAIKSSYLKKFKDVIITPLSKTFFTLEGNILNLESPGGRTKMHLEK